MREKRILSELRELGIAVQEAMPREDYDLMDLFLQTSQRRPGVEFIPLPYRAGTAGDAAQDRALI